MNEKWIELRKSQLLLIANQHKLKLFLRNGYGSFLIQKFCVSITCEIFTYIAMEWGQTYKHCLHPNTPVLTSENGLDNIWKYYSV